MVVNGSSMKDRPIATSRWRAVNGLSQVRSHATIMGHAQWWRVDCGRIPRRGNYFPGPGGSTVFLHKATVSVSFPHEVSRWEMGLGGGFEGKRSTCLAASLTRSVHVSSREGVETDGFGGREGTRRFLDGGTGTATLSVGISCPALLGSEGFHARVYRLSFRCTRHGCGDVRGARERGGGDACTSRNLRRFL